MKFLLEILDFRLEGNFGKDFLVEIVVCVFLYI